MEKTEFVLEKPTERQWAANNMVKRQPSVVVKLKPNVKNDLLLQIEARSNLSKRQGLRYYRLRRRLIYCVK